MALQSACGFPSPNAIKPVKNMREVTMKNLICFLPVLLCMPPVTAQQTPCPLETGGTYSSKLNTLIYEGYVAAVIHTARTLFTITINSASNTYSAMDDV